MENTKREKRGGGLARLRPRTLQGQLTSGCLLVLVIFITAVIIITRLFLEDYYVQSKAEIIAQVQTRLESLDLAEIYDEELQAIDIPDELRKLSVKNNLNWAVMNNDDSLAISWPPRENQLEAKLFGYVFDLDKDVDSSIVLDSRENWTLQKVGDHFSGMNYLECWGQMDNKNYFLIRTPLESIKDSVSTAYRFFISVGVILIVLTALVLWLVLRRLTRPIGDLTHLSERMCSLDFEARYTSHAGNEIDDLGKNFNRLSGQLKQTFAELKSANLKLQADIQDRVKIDEMRKEFLDNVSHELKTPIALIQGYAEGLRDLSGDPESREFYTDVIIDEAQKMNKLVKSLLTLNQLESGRDAPVMECFDITALIMGVLASMDILIREKGAKIVFKAPEPVYVWADEFKTEEVMTNYISNALNHLDGEKVIEIRLIPKEQVLKISVFNTGSPIPEAELDNLWQKFYKVDKARTRSYGGSGIGLSIVKAIMESMHQTYGVRNYDNGVEFWCTLELKEDPEEFLS